MSERIEIRETEREGERKEKGNELIFEYGEGRGSVE